MIRLLFAILFFGLATSALAVPTDAMLDKMTKHVVKVHVAFADGSNGTGSGVVIAKDRIVTNCHVVANASNISVSVGDQTYTANAITPDWYHDVCLVTVDGLDAPIAKIGVSKNLAYEQSVFAIGYPKLSTEPSRTLGSVKELLAMDDSVVVRASSTFKRGQSGGGLFDDAGNLVGVITLKSPGKQVYYYHMPVEWVQALLDQPEQVINAKAAPAFWATKSNEWPFFMQVVHPYLTGNWTVLLSVAKNWVAQEPNNNEALFYLAAAEYAIDDRHRAEMHLKKVMTINPQHSQAKYQLARITQDATYVNR